MFGLFVKSLAQLSDPRTRGVVWRALGLGLLLYVAVVAGVWWGLSFLSETRWETVNALIAAAGGLVALVAGALIYPALVTVLIGLFSEAICRRVEALHYPERGAGREQPLTEILVGTINFAGKTLALNLLTLLLTFIIPGVNIFVFIAINGYLVSVEYFEMAAVRRVDLKQTNALRKRHFFRLWGAGAVFAVGMAVPVIGIVAPVVAMIFMVHVLETVRLPATKTPETGGGRGM
ncbi:MAG: EI24 domain-containing protein [Rhodospirillaceae bacterium]